MRAQASAHSYRSDIDGLRAIAVLSVIIFHAREAWLPGGFVGVDIFFVISGYLISKHIAAEVSDGRFSLLEFYRRRIRRIAPMMMTVVAATLLAALLIMTPEDGRAAAKSAIWSVASMANVHFWRDLDTGYFANSTAEVPLLHLWSLGVEEQFYFIWPLVLVVAVRKLPARLLLGLTVLVAALSFQLASWIFPKDASFAYYMLPTRMGELLMGALLGVGVVLEPRPLGRPASQLLGWVGLALVGLSLFAIDRHDPFPGWYALPSTLGAALLILAGEFGPNPVPGLASAPMVFVGRLSYSAYLWHWPLFALYRYGYGDPSGTACIVIIAITMLLAWLSFEAIERPTRGSLLPFRTLAVRQFVVPAVLLLLPALAVVFAAKLGLPLASADYQARIESLRETTRPAHTFDWICQRQRLGSADVADPRCVQGPEGLSAPRALLWGDSNAAHYTAMVKVFAAQAGVRFRNFEVGSCPPLLSDPTPYVEARRLADCQASAALARAELDKYPVILISAAWSSYIARGAGFMDEFRGMVRRLVEQGHDVVLIGKAPVLSAYDRRCKEKALRVPFKSCPDAPERLAEEVSSANKQLAELARQLPRVTYFDPNVYLCPEGLCSKLTEAGLPRYFDASHLTLAGSTELGLKVLAAHGLPPAFEPLRP